MADEILKFRPSLPIQAQHGRGRHVFLVLTALASGMLDPVVKNGIRSPAMVTSF